MFHSCVNKIEILTFAFALPPLSFPQQSVTLPEVPAVVVFKDGGYVTYDGESYLFFGLLFDLSLNKTLRGQRGGVCLSIIPLPPLLLAFFIAVCMFSHRCRSSSLIFLAAL